MHQFTAHVSDIAGEPCGQFVQVALHVQHEDVGVLDGSTNDGEWVDHVENDDVLVLNVEGDLNELAAGFARDVRDMGGELMHFREFLVISPPGREIDTDRLS